jgi:dipeptidyl-peptidase-4
MNKRLNTLLGLIGFSLASSLSAVNAEQLSIERIMQAPSLSGQSPVGLKVSPDGERVTFLKGKVDDYERFDLWEYHIASGKTQMLFDSDDLHTGEEVLSDEEKARRERMRVYGTGIMSYHWSHDGKALIFPLAGDVFYFRLGDKKAKQLLDTPEFETDIKFSPKSNYVSYIRNQNLYVMNIDSGNETAITTKGGGNIKYGMSEFVAQEEMSRMTGYWWSPDERHIAFTKVDESPVEVITRSEIYADSIKTIEQKYPKAGTDNVHIELAISGIDNNELNWIDLGDNKDIYLARAQWINESVLSFQTQRANTSSL